MSSERSRGWSLSKQATVLVTVSVLLTVLVVGAVSLGGVYELAREETDARLRAYRQLVTDHIDERLKLVDRIMDGAATRDVIQRADLTRAAQTVVRIGSANGEHLEVMAIVDEKGKVLAKSSSAPFASLPAEIRVPADATEHTAFVWQSPSGADRAGALWAFRRDPQGPAGRIVVARVRTGSISRLLEQVTQPAEGRSAVLIDKDGRQVSLGATAAVDVSSLVLRPDIETTATGVARPGAASLIAQGTYGSISSAPELGWRLVVLDPGRDALDRTRRILLPAGLVMVLASAIAIAASFLWSRRVVAPLRVFERRAQEVASGGYVRPAHVDRDDEVGRLADAFNKMGVRLNSLQDMARLLASGSNLDDVLDSVLAATNHMFGTSDAAVMLVDDERRGLSLARGHGLRDAGVTYWVPLDADSPVSHAVAEARSVELQSPADEWGQALYRLFDAEEDRPGVVVPLLLGDEAVGVIVVISAGRKPFTDAQIETLHAFSAHAAIAVDNSRLFEHERASRKEAEALREAAELIVGPIEPAVALARVTVVARDLLGAQSCTLALADRDSLGLPPSDDPDREERLLRLWRHVAPPADTSAPGPVLVKDVDADPRVRRLVGKGPSQVLLVPLLRASRAEGVLVLKADPAPGDRGFVDRDVMLADTIGKELSLAIENAALLIEARARAANLETIFRISQAVSSSLQLSVVLNRVLDVVQKIFTADAVALMGYEPSRRVISTTMARGVSVRDMLYYSVRPGEDVPGQVFADGIPISLGNLEQSDSRLAALALSQDMRSLLSVPLRARGRSIGVLTVFARETNAFSGDDMGLLLTFASQAALAIDTAGLYGREHHVSSVLQASILPASLPSIPGLDAEAFYLPVGGDAEIGGDFYDLFQLRDGRVVVAIGDVCGKGVLAATKTSMIRYSLRGMVAAGSGPAATLAELNHLVSATGDPADIVTCWIGFLDLEQGSITYANGGHPPGLIARAGGRTIERLDPTGPLLGATDDARYEERTLPLSVGDLLMTYTDGVTEARHGDSFFGEGRIRRAMRAATCAGDAVQGLLEAVSSFSAGLMRDDAAVLAVQVLPPQAAEEAPPEESG